jgi:hypothetical protein
MFDLLQADIVVMQELKIQRKDLTDDMVLLDGWDCFFSLPRQKKGWWRRTALHPAAADLRNTRYAHIQSYPRFSVDTDCK